MNSGCPEIGCEEIGVGEGIKRDEYEGFDERPDSVSKEIDLGLF